MSPRFSPTRAGFEELTVYRPGMDMPRAGDVVERDYEFAQVVEVTIKPAIGDGRPLELGAERGDVIHRATYEWLPSCTCGFGPSVDCERHKVLTWGERAAAGALYQSPVEVGREGIGGFAAGQAEETILALRIAGFPVDPAAG